MTATMTGAAGLVTAREMWAALCREAQELLLTARADAPILADPVVVRALIKLGLITHDLTLTPFGVSVVVNR